MAFQVGSKRFQDFASAWTALNSKKGKKLPSLSIPPGNTLFRGDPNVKHPIKIQAQEGENATLILNSDLLANPGAKLILENITLQIEGHVRLKCRVGEFGL